jgi:hypothetical protein
MDTHFRGRRAFLGRMAMLGPQTDRAREMVKAFIARNLAGRRSA